MTRWTILTGEYPPQAGGVSDYTRLVAAGLVATGDSVRVFAPPSTPASVSDSNVGVVRLPDHFGPRALAALDERLRRHPRPDRILVQYVPHAFGWKGLNLPFAVWLATRARRVAPVWVMFHEVAFPFSWRPPSHAVLGVVTQLMARLVAGAAGRIFVSTPAWGSFIRSVYPRLKAAEWLPVPSNIPCSPSIDRLPLGELFPALHGCTIVGHFGTYGPLITELLDPSLSALCKMYPECSVVLLGRGGIAHRERLEETNPALRGRVFATGEMRPQEIADALSQCDALIQPYPDGVCTRRTSAMAGLALGRLVVTNLGPASEPVWAETGCVALAPRPDAQEIARVAAATFALSTTERSAIGEIGAALYRAKFGVEHTVATLRGPRPLATSSVRPARRS